MQVRIKNVLSLRPRFLKLAFYSVLRWRHLSQSLLKYIHSGDQIIFYIHKHQHWSVGNRAFFVELDLIWITSKIRKCFNSKSIIWISHARFHVADSSIGTGCRGNSSTNKRTRAWISSRHLYLTIHVLVVRNSTKEMSYINDAKFRNVSFLACIRNLLANICDEQYNWPWLTLYYEQHFGRWRSAAMSWRGGCRGCANSNIDTNVCRISKRY